MFGKATKPKPAASPMTVTVNQPVPCQYRLTIHLKPAAVQPVRDGVVQEVQREATVPGFRKGKAPKALVEQQHPKQIREETLRRLTRQVVDQVTTERQLKPVGPFEVTRLEFDEATGFDLEAQVEVEPEFTLGDYRRLRLSATPVAVGAEEVAQALAKLQESAAQLVPAAEGQPKTKQLPALDDEFAKDVGFETLEALKVHLEATLREQHTAEAKQQQEQELCDALLARHQFEVPPRLVARQTERLTKDFQARLLLSGRAEEAVKEELARYTGQLRTNATRLVKLAFILERLAKAEQLSVTQDEVVERLWALSRRMGKDPAEVRRLLDARGLWPSVLSSILQEKTMRFLFSVAEIEGAQRASSSPVSSGGSPPQPKRDA